MLVALISISLVADAVIFSVCVSFDLFPPNNEKPDRLTRIPAGTIIRVAPNMENADTLIFPSSSSAFRKSIETAPHKANEEIFLPGFQGCSPTFTPLNMAIFPHQLNSPL